MALTLCVQRPLSDIWSYTNAKLTKPCVIALGVFDGIHRGHQTILHGALQEAEAQGLDSLVFSFWNHPQTLLKHTTKPLLTLPEERLAFFETLGFQHICMPFFDETLQAMPAEVFLHTYLLEACRMQRLWVGQNFCFGAERKGTVAFLEEAALSHQHTHAHLPWQVHAPELLCDTSHSKSFTDLGTSQVTEVICSTRIREALQQEGNLETVTRYLGRPYQLSGTVIHGAKRGRSIGFPTANLKVSPEKCLPAKGVYIVEAFLPSRQKHYWGACNVGQLPTIQAIPTSALSLEVHLLDFPVIASLASTPVLETFYGESITLTFHQKIRDEQKFENLEALRTQIVQDIACVRRFTAQRSQPHAVSI
ncbi:MAG: bifunctional riboflavin kinase/FMN adenylyltransferase [Vampirovibrionales bacterium]